ncbi:MAG: FeoA family protein [Thiovulaceae bacterium]|jgi:Fe2+ transport system protein FeoA|nr:FeoA family protein [Sulfurimonadaceae bacterium]MDD3817588.1 FeoA family protein [Sulfurimonadaceae bacterium]
MTLYDCRKGDLLRVLKIQSETTLKQRLISFGIMKGAKIEVLEHAPAKSTIEVKVSKTRVALRDKEAQLIEVEKI